MAPVSSNTTLIISISKPIMSKKLLRSLSGRSCCFHCHIFFIALNTATADKLIALWISSSEGDRRTEGTES